MPRPFVSTHHIPQFFLNPVTMNARYHAIALSIYIYHSYFSRAEAGRVATFSLNSLSAPAQTGSFRQSFSLSR